MNRGEEKTARWFSPSRLYRIHPGEPEYGFHFFHIGALCNYFVSACPFIIPASPSSFNAGLSLLRCARYPFSLRIVFLDVFYHENIGF